MEDLNIPGWAVVLCGGIFPLLIGWLIWLTMKTSENDKAIAINNNNDTSVSKELHKLDIKIDELKKDTKDWMVNMDLKMERGFDRVFHEIERLTK